MKRSIVLVMLALVIMGISGCIFSSDDSKEVKKGSVSGTVKMEVTGEPLANVKVMLVNKDAKIDTVNGADNYSAFVDSAFTDAAGAYVIDTVPQGNYGVVPIYPEAPDSYQFSPAEDSGPYEFRMNGESRTVNFSAKLNLQSTIGGLNIEVRVKKTAGYEFTYTYAWRRVWFLVVPTYISQGGGDRGEAETYKSYAFSFFPGRTLLLVSWDNYFNFKVYYKKDNASIGQVEFSINLPFVNPPMSTVWEYDITTHRVTRI